jgi:hypothetical protein
MHESNSFQASRTTSILRTLTRPAIALALGALISVGVAHLMKWQVYLDNRETWDWTDSMPHMFGIGIQLMFLVMPFVFFGGILNLTSFFLYWKGRKAQQSRILIFVLWTAWIFMTALVLDLFGRIVW